ncbi:MAG: uroporphyrinogen-III synthase [Bacteroidales bacterium]|nr:uroporphyrinogen-III synthase [Bacteroidales bacterium]
MKIKKILVSQPKPKTNKSPYYDIADKYNVKIDFHPFIKVEPIYAKEFRRQRINILAHTAIIFNARHGIDHFFRLCEEMRITVPETMKYFCVSETVALYLQKYIQYRKRKIFFTQTGKFADLPALLNKHTDEKYLYVTSNVRNEETMSILESSKITFDQAIMYKTVSNKIPAEELRDYDMMIFFSPVGIKSLFENDPNFVQGETQIGCLGTNTAFAIREAGLRLDLEAPTPEFPSMAMALEDHLKKDRKSNGKK